VAYPIIDGATPDYLYALSQDLAGEPPPGEGNTDQCALQ
jgi:hypothetical protein